MPRKLTKAQAEVICGACVKASWNFWGIRDDWNIKTHIYANRDLGGSLGYCYLNIDYLTVDIKIYLPEIESPEELWAVTAHEMAHVVLAEYDIFHRVVATNKATDEVWQFATERTTTLLERVFLRENPYPNDLPIK